MNEKPKTMGDTVAAPRPTDAPASMAARQGFRPSVGFTQRQENLRSIADKLRVGPTITTQVPKPKA